MKFTRKDLEEKLGLRNDQRKLVMKFQKELPILRLITFQGDLPVDNYKLV